MPIAKLAARENIQHEHDSEDSLHGATMRIHVQSCQRRGYRQEKLSCSIFLSHRYICLDNDLESTSPPLLQLQDRSRGLLINLRYHEFSSKSRLPASNLPSAFALLLAACLLREPQLKYSIPATMTETARMRKIPIRPQNWANGDIAGGCLDRFPLWYL